MAAAAVVFAAALAQAQAQAGAPVQAGPIPANKGELAIQGKVTVPGSPEATYAAATDFERWPQDLPDVRDMKIVERSPQHAVIEYTSKILGPRSTVTFDLDPDHHNFNLTLKGAGFGDVKGHMDILSSGNNTSTATLTITSRRTGGVSNLIPAGVIKDRMTRKIESDLTALYKRMTTNPPAIGGSGQQQGGSQQ